MVVFCTLVGSVGVSSVLNSFVNLNCHSERMSSNSTLIFGFQDVRPEWTKLTMDATDR